MPGRPERSALTVGIRELKSGLSRHLRKVQEGQTIAVTDRGRVIAMINPVEKTDLPPAIKWARAMVAAGKAQWAGGKPAGAEKPARLQGAATLADAIIEDRR
jgi:antitoxin (DNA-binding transcriptional repressor) of toxin-antitoxin stability system